MNAIVKLVMDHQVLSTIAGYAIWSTFVGSLDAPTASDGRAYRMFFKFCNGLAFNFQRALNTTIENSPNWQAALAKATLPKP